MAVSPILLRWASILCVCLFVALQSYGQNITNYSFTKSEQNFSTLGVGTGVTTLFSQGGGLDDQIYTISPAGFEFWFMGQRYTSFKVSSNGWISLGDGVITSLPTNSLFSSSARPAIIAPLWDDLEIYEGVLLTLLGYGSMSYKLENITGVGRVLSVQWYRAKWDKNSRSGAGTLFNPYISEYVLSFQVKLYERTGNILFNYGQTDYSVSGTSGASVGIASLSNGNSNTFLSLNDLTSSAVVSSSIENKNIQTRPADNQAYIFNPEETSAPTNLTFTAVGTTGTTLNWKDNSSDELGFAIYRSLDNTSFSYVGQTTANVTSFNSTSLNANTTYYYRVYAVRENLSEGLTGSQATLSVCSISQVSIANIVAHYRMSANALDFYAANNGTLWGSPTTVADRFDIANSAYSFNGSNQYMSTANSYTDPNVFTISVWFKTTVAGGKLIGFGSSQTGFSTNADRHIYMGVNGRIFFGVKPGAVFKTISSSVAYNDGNWHMATATMSVGGMVLYIDGVMVAQDASVNSGEAYGGSGYWRLAYDNIDGWAGMPENRYFSGSLDDAYIYHRALTAEEVLELYRSADDVVSNAPVCVGVNLNFSAPAVLGATYSWTGPNGFTSSQQNPSVSFALNRVGVYTVAVSFGGCAVSSSTRVVAPVIVGQWTGNSSTNWSNADNWCNGVLPTNTVNVLLPLSGVVNNPTLTSTGSAMDISVQSGRTLTIGNGGDLQIAGEITNMGAIIATSGAVTMNGIIAQTIPANTFSGNLIKDLTINNAAGVVLDGPLRLTGVLTASDGIFNANGHLTLASGASSTAQVAPISLGASIRGNVIVERFIQGGAMFPYRTTRMLSSSVYDNTEVFINSDLGGERSAKFSQLIDNIIVTSTAGAAGGFDLNQSGGASAWTYNSGFVPVVDINTAVVAGRGMYAFFRGNRDNPSLKTNYPYVDPEDTIVDFKGILNQGDVSVSLPAGGHLLGNPYAATIDWDSPSWGEDKAGVGNVIWIWNPATRSYATYTGGVGLLGGSRYIASGQSFFARTTSATTIKFKESIKASEQQPPSLLMSVGKGSGVAGTGGEVMAAKTYGGMLRSLFRISMKPIASYGEDETVVVFNEGSSNGYDQEDAQHIDGEVVNISTLVGVNRLSINFLSPMPQGMGLAMHVGASATGSYFFNFNLDEYSHPYNLILKDAYLNRLVPITRGLVYNFGIDKDISQTFGANRFSVIVEPFQVLPVGLVSFVADKQNSGVLLKWSVSNGVNGKLFKLYRSIAEGKGYVFLGDVVNKGAGSYVFFDTSPLFGYSYYKLVQVDVDGKTTERGPVLVNFNIDHDQSVLVYPNPAIDRFVVKSDVFLLDKYKLVLHDVTGGIVGDYSVSKADLRTGYEVDVSKLGSGVFFVKIVEFDNGKTEAVVTLIKK